uniref:Uncharacterized protein n=1 Tax=Setaria italica TaxID=4555 RepID=K3Y092_SETIT
MYFIFLANYVHSPRLQADEQGRSTCSTCPLTCHNSYTRLCWWWQFISHNVFSEPVLSSFERNHRSTHSWAVQIKFTRTNTVTLESERDANNTMRRFKPWLQYQ